MDPRVAPLADILRLNTRLFHNCLLDLTEEQADVRPSATTNSLAFVAAHVTDSRYHLLKLLGDERRSPLADALDRASGIDDMRVRPPLAEVQAAWTDVSAALDERLRTIGAAELEAPLAVRFPMEDRSLLGTLAFLVQHDSYHVGQLALLRKFVGLPAMSYA